MVTDKRNRKLPDTRSRKYEITNFINRNFCRKPGAPGGGGKAPNRFFIHNVVRVDWAK